MKKCITLKEAASTLVPAGRLVTFPDRPIEMMPRLLFFASGHLHVLP